jgi:hypothetical protein
LAGVIQGSGMDISFGISQRIVPYHWYGNGSLTVENVLAVREYVFEHPDEDIRHMCSKLAGCYQQAQNGDLSPVDGDANLGALAIYNGGHLYPADDPWWQRWSSNIASYKVALERAKEMLG